MSAVERTDNNLVLFDNDLRDLSPEPLKTRAELVKLLVHIVGRHHRLKTPAGGGLGDSEAASDLTNQWSMVANYLDP